MRRNAFWGFVLVAAGVLFLMDSTGILNIDAWGVLWALVILGAGVWMLMRYSFSRELKDSGSLNIPLEGASQADIKLKHGAGRLSFDAGADAGDLISGTFNDRLRHTAEKVGDVLQVKIRGDSWYFPFAEPRHWTLRLNESIPMTLNIDSGAGESQVDLSALKVSDFRLSSGASATRITLPAGAGFTKAKIDSGVGSIQIRIPEGVAASIHTSGGLSNTTVNRNRFPRSAGRYQSPDYEQAENKVELVVSTGVGAIDIR